MESIDEIVEEQAEDKSNEEEEEEEEECRAILIDVIEGDGITHNDIIRLRNAGFFTVECIMYSPKSALTRVNGISEAKADKLLAAARKHVSMALVTSLDEMHETKKVIRITTGSTEIDNILRGGVETGAVTEIFGLSGAGKTQFCLSLCVNCQLPVERGGGGGRAVFVDTEGAFRPVRLCEIADRYSLPHDAVLLNVMCGKPETVDQVAELLINAAALMCQARYSLVVVDSIISLFRTEYNGRGELSARQHTLGRMVRMLHRMAREFGCAIVFTNHMIAQVDGFVGGEKHVPAGGNMLAHMSGTRLYLRKGPSSTRVCKVYNSSYMEATEAQFSITSHGIVDFEKK